MTLAFGFGVGWDAGLRIGGGCVVVGLSQAVLFERLVAARERSAGRSVHAHRRLLAVHRDQAGRPSARVTEGERWAREALDRLRAEDFTGPAFARFLGASQRRADENRASRPELAAQARRWSAVGAAAWLIVDRSPRGLAWWGLTVLMLDWHLGMVETESGEPRPLGPADACTLARSWMVPLAADRAAPLVVAAGFALDAVDGPLSRATAPTRAGRDLEGAVDAAFTVAALRGAVRSGGLGRVAAMLEAGRLATGFAVTCAAYFGRSRPPDRAASRAARGSSPVRAAGLFAAGLGYRRTANALVVSGALAGVAAAASGGAT